MKFNLSITALVASVLLATNVEARWQPTPGLTWDYLLGAKDDVVKASKQQVVTFDLEQAERLVPYVHSKGQKAICYFSGGTTEHRAYDREEYQKSGLALGGNGDDWGNQWLDIRNKAKLQPLIRKRMQRARSYGCDAVEVDCLGIYHYRSDYTKEDSYVFAKWVAETAHQEGISIGLKNVAGIAESLEPYFDFAVVESCAKGNTCKNYKNFTQHQKAVFIVHYGESFTLSGSSLNTLIEAQKGMHFTCVFSQNNKLHDNVTNYDCNSGSTISGGKLSTTSSTTTTLAAMPTTTTVAASSTPSNGVVAPATPAAPGTPMVPGNATDPTTGQPLLSNVTTGSSNTTEPKVLQELGYHVSTEKEDNNNNIISAMVAIVATGGVATAAVAGFIFVKKNKRFSSKDASLDI